MFDQSLILFALTRTLNDTIVKLADVKCHGRIISKSKW